MSHAFPAQARDGAEYVNQLKVLAKRMNVRTGKLSQMLLPYGEETSTLEQAHASNVAEYAELAKLCAEFKSSTRLQRERTRQFRRNIFGVVENSTRAIDSSKNQPNRLRFDRAREF